VKIYGPWFPPPGGSFVFTAIDRPHPGALMQTKTFPGKPGEPPPPLSSLNEPESS